MFSPLRLQLLSLRPPQDTETFSESRSHTRGEVFFLFSPAHSIHAITSRKRPLYFLLMVTLAPNIFHTFFPFSFFFSSIRGRSRPGVLRFLQTKGGDLANLSLSPFFFPFSLREERSKATEGGHRFVPPFLLRQNSKRCWKMLAPVNIPSPPPFASFFSLLSAPAPPCCQSKNHCPPPPFLPTARNTRKDLFFFFLRSRRGHVVIKVGNSVPLHAAKMLEASLPPLPPPFFPSHI